jgi:hypothetical protein
LPTTAVVVGGDRRDLLVSQDLNPPREPRQARLIQLLRCDVCLNYNAEKRHFGSPSLPFDHNPFQGPLVAVVAQFQDSKTGT